MTDAKMTAKRFWEILSEVGYPKDIYGYEGILNIIACLEWNDMDYWLNKNNERMANRSKERATKIHDLLEEWDEHFYE